MKSKEFVVIDINDCSLAMTRYNCKTILSRLLDFARCETCNNRKFRSVEDAEMCKEHVILQLKKILSDIENDSYIDVLVGKNKRDLR